MINLSDKDADNTKAVLPARLISLLSDAKLPLKAGKNGVYTIEAKKLFCKRGYRTAIEPSNPLFEIGTSSCFINSAQGSQPSGTEISQADGLFDFFSDKLDLTDCAMGGRCYTWVKSVICSIDTKIEIPQGAGRFTCQVNTDEQ